MPRRHCSLPPVGVIYFTGHATAVLGCQGGLCGACDPLGVLYGFREMRFELCDGGAK